MVVRREKKRKYYRGSRTYGWGRVGQHRRRGRKAGRGRVGYHKHKWTWTVKYAPDLFGKHGFTRPPEIIPDHRWINVGELDELIPELKKKGLIEEVEGKMLVDLVKIGYTKLLGRGHVTQALLVKTLYATKTAIEKIEGAGGKVEVLRG
ncbi:MAG: 50S ribosomal protein L15 [Thermoprotei archaeon]|nr:MAG: 50S ribosomal protein L15 [Thermoprotei archaeon]